MANFTELEKMKFRRYLGYSAGYKDWNIALESMMDVVANQTEAAAYARELLISIADVDTSLAVTGGGSSATYGAVKSVDEISFYDVKNGSSGNATLSGVAYGDMLIERLRSLFGVELAGRYFHSGATNSFFFGPGT